MEILIRQEWIDRARAAGACQLPDAGIPVSKLTQTQLIWAEQYQIVTPAELAALGVRLPIWCLSGSGSGYGYGYGVGYVSGYGFGDGSGDGDGDGYGSSYGHGYDEGYGSSYGHGYDEGHGYGDGSGD